jgi:protein required for attachment to host cells
MKQWILISDASEAKVFSTTGRLQPLRLEMDFANTTGRARTQDLVSDSPGRVQKSGSPGARSATEPHTTAHEAAAQDFARELARVLRHQLQQGSFDALVIAAPPHFLGMLRALLDKDVAASVKGEVAKDLIRVPENELRQHLNGALEFSQQV